MVEAVLLPSRKDKMQNRNLARLSALLLACSAAFAALPATGAYANAQFTLETTVQAGKIARDIVVDDTRNRAYVVVDRGENTAGAITWINTADNQPSTQTWELSAAAPSSMALNKDGTKLYVAHYRNQVFSIIDIPSGAVETINGIPKFVAGVVTDTDTDKVYVYDSKGLVPIDLTNKTVGTQISVSKEKYPQVRGVTYDSDNKVFWIAEGRKKLLTAFSTQTNAWVEATELMLATQEFNGQAINGRPQDIELDSKNHKLYILMRATMADNWSDRDRVLTFDTKTHKFIGENYLQAGANVYDMRVNNKTSELYLANGHDNTVSMISPDTWAQTTVIDFNQAGVTNGTGAGAADTWGLGISAAGDKIYVSHPYHSGGSRISAISRSGTIPAYSPRPNTPGQTAPAAPINQPWTGSAAPTTDPAPFCAVKLSEQTLAWGINDYAHAWKVTTRGAVTLENSEYKWTGGTGWYNPQTGAAQLSLPDGFHIQHYETLVPALVSTWGNPQLQVNPDKTATMTMDIYWATSATANSGGYKRVSVATFKQVTVLAQGDELVVTGVPEWEGREYTSADGTVRSASWPSEFIDYFDQSMRPWWYKSGAHGDVNKPAKQIFAGGKFGQSPCPAKQELLLDTVSAAHGEVVTATATGFVAGQEVTFELHSNPLMLGTAIADSTGSAALTFTVPTTAPTGAHQVIVSQAVSGLHADAALTVTAGAVPVKPQSPKSNPAANSADNTAISPKTANKLAQTGAELTHLNGLVLASALVFGALGIAAIRRRG